MANLTITAANVLASASALGSAGTAGAAITQGQALFKDSTDGNRLKLADSNVNAATARVEGIALNAASIGQPVRYVYQDDAFTPGAALVVGEVYTLSATPGAICPVADLATGDRPVVLFVAISETQAVVRIVRGTAAIVA